jgi:hypothetical protein
VKPRTALFVLAAALALVSVVQFGQRRALAADIAALGVARDEAAAHAGDARLITQVERIRFALEQARGQPAKSADAHLALALGDGRLTLERGDIVFRTTTVEAEVPRGVHLIERVEDRVVTLSGGIRLRPVTADSTPLEKGEIRVPREDFLAIRPNLKPGQSAFFF